MAAPPPPVRRVAPARITMAPSPASAQNTGQHLGTCDQKRNEFVQIQKHVLKLVSFGCKFPF